MRLKKKKSSLSCLYWKLLLGLLFTFATAQVGKERKGWKKEKGFSYPRNSARCLVFARIHWLRQSLFYNDNKFYTIEKEIQKAQICPFLERKGILTLYYLCWTGTKHPGDHNYQDTEMSPKKPIHSNHLPQEKQCKIEFGELLWQNRKLKMRPISRIAWYTT